MLRAVYFAFAFLIVSISATAVEKCKSGPLPLGVEVDGCTAPPCDVIKGSSALMNVQFLGAKDNTKKITAKVRATALGITTSYDLPDEISDVCKNLLYGASCPIDKSEDVTYKFKFPLEDWYPEIKVKIEISLVDEDKDSLACFQLDIKVKKGK